MRQAALLLGVLTLLMAVGVYLAFRDIRDPSPSHVTPQDPMSLTLTSPAFTEGGSVPPLYTCDGDNVSPELHIDGVPEGTRSLVLVMDDPDIPDAVKQSRGIEKFDHWAVYNIPADTRVIPMGALLGVTAHNSRGEARYTGPCPPDREHRYIFRLYAVPDTLTFTHIPTLDEVEALARPIMIEEATLIGRYARQQQ